MLAWATQSFLRRLTLAMGLLVLATAGAVGLVASRLARTHLTDELASRLELEARLLLLQVPREGLLKPDLAAADAWADAAGARGGARVTLTRRDGRVVGDSETPLAALAQIENHAARAEIAGALREGRGTAVRTSATVGRAFLYLALPVAEGGRALGTLRLALPMTEVHAKVARLQRAIGLASGLCLLGALALSVAVSRSIHRPVGELAEVADRLASGDFKARAEAPSGDELGRLAGVLNGLAGRVEAMLAELSAEKARLEATFDNMVEGVAVVDAQGRLQDLNRVMERLFGVAAAAARGKPFVEGLRNAQLQELLEDGLAAREPRVREISLFAPEERVFEASVRPMADAGAFSGAVMVLHDITRLRRLEEVRKEFVANASHELRTPLAAIKGYAETLRRGGIEDAANRLEFVRTIEAQADRLARLLDELLDLAAIETGKRELKPERVDLRELVAAVIAGLAPVAEPLRVRVESAVPEGLAIAADRAAARQVLQNLVENAIKYNREGGGVSIGARAAGGRVELCVADTGIGIPAADLPRVFERFYRVDKARSRELGGTGLGLSIVKHLVEAHGGEARVESVEGEGSRFFVSFPAAT